MILRFSDWGFTRNTKMLMEITDLDNLLDKIKSIPAILVYLYNDACSPCLALRPKVLSMVSEEFPMMELNFINAAANPEIAGHFLILSAPTLIVFFEGKETIRESEYISIPELENKIERYYNMLMDE